MRNTDLKHREIGLKGAKRLSRRAICRPYTYRSGMYDPESKINVRGCKCVCVPVSSRHMVNIEDCTTIDGKEGSQSESWKSCKA